MIVRRAEAGIDYGGDAAALLDAGFPGSRAAVCLVWGADLCTGDRGRGDKAALRRIARVALADAGSRPELEHLVLLYRSPSADRLRPFAERLAGILHADLERATGRDIDVILLDVTGLDSPEPVEARIRQLASRPAGLAGAAAIGWRDIARQSIAAACDEGYL